jgi:hypothetical protein
MAGGRPTGVAKQAGVPLTEEQWRAKILAAIAMRKEGWSEAVVQRRHGQTHALKKKAAELGIEWPKFKRGVGI